MADVLAASDSDPDEETVGQVGSYLDVARLLGSRTAEMHRALARRTDDPAFTPEPFSALYQRSVFQTLRNHAGATLTLLRRRLDTLPDDARPLAERVLDRSDDVLAMIRELTTARRSAVRIRTHGDFHAGQVLWTGREVVLIDFEGEPGRPLSERRHKRSALSDVAGMLRSFHYAAYGTLLNPRLGGTVRAEDVERLDPWAELWYRSVAACYLRAYLDSSADEPYVPRDREELLALLELSALQKVLYELSYELNNRPDWVSIPLRGLLELIENPPSIESPTT
jgi:maltose alpha-D-glucosyltransferase/alpha-amylase